MNIEVKLFGTLRDYLPETSSGFSFGLEIKRGFTVRDLMNHLRIPAGVPAIILVNSTKARHEKVLQSGDLVTIIPPINGG
jgi:molybdopterin converting factor small subunit